MSELGYRPCVGVMMVNTAGKVFVAERLDSKHGTGHTAGYWQMPQGGIDEGEKPKAAAKRELWEETGIRVKDVTLLGSVEDWLYYDFPPEHQGPKSRGWMGQRQKWFAFRYHGNEKKIDLKSHGPQEFSKWKWAELSDAPKLIVPFKRKVYDDILAMFSHIGPKKVA